MPDKVYLQPRELVTHSRRHTVYTGAPSAPKTEAGHSTQLIRQVFLNGVAHNVPEDIYKVLKDQGHCDTKKPVFDDAE